MSIATGAALAITALIVSASEAPSPFDQWGRPLVTLADWCGLFCLWVLMAALWFIII